MVIQPMTKKDIAEVLAIDLVSFHPSDLEKGDPRPSRELQLRAELDRSWARLRVARVLEGGPVLGYILFWHVTDELHLLNVAVAPEARRKGIGHALVADLLTYAREHAAVKVLLEVRASNEAAIRLYESFGFERFNVRKAYYPDGEDGTEMMLELGAPA